MTDNIIFTLDAYKWGHEGFYVNGTQNNYAYLESRKGSMYPYSRFFGLQYIIKKWLVKPVTQEMLDEAIEAADETFFDDKNVFNAKSWQRIIDECDGYLPLSIKAVPEGEAIPTGNVMTTVEATKDGFGWLANGMETLLQQVWYTTTACTRSSVIMNVIKKYFDMTCDIEDFYKFFLHDFAQRGVTCMEQAGIGGMAHLVNGLGSDTMMAIPYAKQFYDADKKGLLFSVKATEHAQMTALGKDEEFEVTKEIIRKHPNGILSVVSDSYNITNAVNAYCNELKPLIMARNGKFVVRPDSPRWENDTPEEQVLWIVETLWNSYGGTLNSKGYKVLDSHTGVIYGDSLTEEQIEQCLITLMNNGYSAENCVYGCGGYLLMKLNRDTQRFAFKCSSQMRDGVWHDVQKNPLDASKASKAGRLKLIKNYDLDGNWKYDTINEHHPMYYDFEDELIEVFRDGKLLVNQTFGEIRERANRIKI
jgi:nicotinamide phosphoribosyltransferase